MKKFLIFGLVLISGLIIFANPVQAQQQKYVVGFNISTAECLGYQLTAFPVEVFNSARSAGSNQICGLTDEALNVINEYGPETLQAYLYQTSPIGQVTSASGELFINRPSSAVAWFDFEYNKVVGNNYAFAQTPNQSSFYSPGSGFSLLQPVAGFWAISRNVAYVFFIVIIMIIGVLIVLRRNVDGQTPITLFNAIPNLILSLVLITFSYPICAIFVDIIPVGTNLVQSILLASPGAPGYNTIWNDPQSNPSRNVLQPDDPEMGVWQVFNTAKIQLCAPNQTGQCNLSVLIPENLGVGNPAASIVSVILQGVEGVGLLNSLVNIVIGFATFSASIKLFMTLIKSYVTLTLSPIVAPWYFFIAALPSNTTATIWDFLKVNLSASLTFVSVYAVLLFIIVFYTIDATSSLSWTPPLIGYDSNFAVNTGLVKAVVCFGLFLVTPTIPEFIDKLIGVPDSSVFGQALGSSLSNAGGQVVGLGRQALSFLPNIGG